jgi:hypothetical protein
MSASTPTAPSVKKPSKPSASPDVLELLPPPGFGFSGTAKFDRHDPASMVLAAELIRRGYTVVGEGA